MATTSYGTPYVQSSDLVSGWPTASLNVADRIDAVSYAGNGINAQTGTSYTLAVTDAGKLVTLNNAAAVAVTLPQDSTANLPVGSVTRIYNLGAGLVTVSAGSGATLQGSSVTVAQYNACNITKLSANTYGIAANGAMSLVTSQSFTTATSVIINNCFSSASRMYRVLIALSATSATNYLTAKLRASGTDSSATYYSGAALNAYGNTVTADFINNGAAWTLGYAATGPAWLAFDLLEPQTSTKTGYLANYASTASTGYFTGYHNTAAAYDGISIFAPGGGANTMTGVIRIYGLRD